jgi:hypothetical protein
MKITLVDISSTGGGRENVGFMVSSVVLEISSVQVVSTGTVAIGVEEVLLECT